jgi:hypothetical protein
MRQRGYPSASSKGVSLRTPGRRPPPPSVLQPDEAAEWLQIVASLPPDFFPRETHPVLTQLCRLIASAHDVANAVQELSPSNPDDLATFSRLVTLELQLSATIASLLTKLRCTNQSRYSTRTAERQAVKSRTKPWDVIDGGKSGGNSPPVSDDADDNEDTWN